jgi:hypothetical protein
VRSGLVVFVVTLVVVFVATGGLRAVARRSPQRLSDAQFVSATDGTCYRAAQRLSPLRKNEAYTTLLKSHLPVLDGMRSSFSGMEPPQNDAASFQLMLDTLDRYLRADRDILRFWESNQLRVYRASLKQERASLQLRRLSAKLGLGWCRWVWTWHPQSP